MQRCSERAFAMCPDRMYCGSIEDATFAENSECAKFNLEVETKPMTNGDRIRSMSDEELAKFISEFCDSSDCEDPGGIKCPMYNYCPMDKLGVSWLGWIQSPAREDRI